MTFSDGGPWISMSHTLEVEKLKNEIGILKQRPTEVDLKTVWEDMMRQEESMVS